MRAYFAHPISLYGTPQERAMIDFIGAELDATVVNPSAREYQDIVARMRAQNIPSSAIMEYFVDICRGCDAVVFTPFPDGSLGAGVVKETLSFLERGQPAFAIESDGTGGWRLKPETSLEGYATLSPVETRAMLGRLGAKGYAPH